jgi:predicted Na+-dependent transporter
MVLVAAMPLSLEIIIMGDLLHIEKNYVFTSVAGTYLGALLIVPLVGVGFLKYMNFNYWNIIVMILCLIVLPLLFSRIAVDKDWDEIIHPHDDMIMDYSLFVVFYAITANCRNFILTWSADLLIIVFIAFTSTFLFYFIARRIGRYFHVPQEKINHFILPGTMKECGLAGGIALTVFSPEVAIPSLIFAVFTYIYMNWLKFRFRHIADSDNNLKV